MDTPFNAPWRVDNGHGSGAIIVDAHARVVCVPRYSQPELAALLSLAPELLRDLTALTDVVCRLDARYCAQRGMQKATLEQIAEALLDAVALLTHARDQGIPLSIPIEVMP